MKRDESAKTREKNRIKDRERERDSVFTIESGNDRSSRNFGANFERCTRFVSFSNYLVRLNGRKWRGRRGIDDKPFSRFRSTLKEFLNGQITAERISSDTFERTRSN